MRTGMGQSWAEEQRGNSLGEGRGRVLGTGRCRTPVVTVSLRRATQAAGDVPGDLAA